MVARTSATKAQLDLLDRVMGYKNTAIVAKMEREHKLSLEDAELLFKETKRFLWLAHITIDAVITPPMIIDKGWHTFILFTKEYMDFCLEMFGQMIHHRPWHPEDDASFEKVAHDLNSSKAQVALQFGSDVSRFWDYGPIEDISIEFWCPNNPPYDKHHMLGRS